jgi:hypothetical protein
VQASQNPASVLVAQNMTQQKNPVVFGGTEDGTAEKPRCFWWHRTRHSRKTQCFLWNRTPHSKITRWFLYSTEHGTAEKFSYF